MVDQDMPSTDAWAPKFPFDIDTEKAKRFEVIKMQFEAWTKAEPITEPLSLTTGWHTITPQMAEQLLRRNRPGANRKASLATIHYYANQMRRGQWQETGQPVIFDEHGVLVDAQHRLWACLLSNTPFTTFVVTGVKAIPHLFAYIDNSKPRNPAAALQTAGYNGVSPVIAAILKIRSDIDEGLYTGSKVGSRLRLAPIDFLLLIDTYPTAKQAARLTGSDYVDAVTLTGHRDVVGYMAMEIIDRFGREEADSFFGELIDFANEYEADNPIMGFRKLMQDDQKKLKGQMQKHQVLGNMIRAFNYWHNGESIKKRWAMMSHEDFPTFVAADAPELDDAA